jgi:hypothetical protein
MSERVLARIWIGGQLRRGESYKLVLAVRRARVSVGIKPFERIICEPKSIEELLESRGELGRLHFQDPEAPGGKMPLLARTCRELGLTYRA